MDVNKILENDITKVNNFLLPENFEINTPSGRLVSNILTEIVDRLGSHSATAQGLSRVMTSADKLRLSPSHTLYLLKDANGNNGKGEVIGLLKIGRKHLYLADLKGDTLEIEPICVLDFFVEPDYQRNGLGKKLFDYMLADLNIPPHHLAVDGPSATMVNFLGKTYGLHDLIKHANNFAVSPAFYDDIKTIRDSASSTPADGLSQGASRFSAPQPRSAIAGIIHGSTVKSPRSSGALSTWLSAPALPSSSPRAFLTYPDESHPIWPKLFGPLRLLCGVKEHREEAKVPTTPEVEDDDEDVLQIVEEDSQMEEPPVEEPELEVEDEARAVERPSTLHVETPAAPDSAAPSPAGSTASRRDSQLTDKGFFDVKFYHNKLW